MLPTRHLGVAGVFALLYTPPPPPTPPRWMYSKQRGTSRWIAPRLPDDAAVLSQL